MGDLQKVCRQLFENDQDHAHGHCHQFLKSGIFISLMSAHTDRQKNRHINIDTPSLPCTPTYIITPAHKFLFLFKSLIFKDSCHSVPCFDQLSDRGNRTPVSVNITLGIFFFLNPPSAPDACALSYFTHALRGCGQRVSCLEIKTLGK